MTPKMHEAEVSDHYNDLINITKKSRHALETAASEGSVRDYLAAIDQALKVHEYVGKEMIRRRIRPHIIEASNILAGAYEGQEDVELGAWASGCDEESIHERAETILTTNKGMY